MRKIINVLSVNEKTTESEKKLKTYFTPEINTINFNVKDCLAASSGDGGIGWNEGWGEGHDIFG